MKYINPHGLRKDLYKILDNVMETNTPVFIIRKNKAVVLISDDDYRSMKETIYLQSVPGLVQSIKEGEKEPSEECKPFVEEE